MTQTIFEHGLFKRWKMIQGLDVGTLKSRSQQWRLHPLLVQLLHQRGITEQEDVQAYFNPSLAQLHAPDLLPGCVRAAERIVEAIKAKQKIVIYGDYDVDGITASAILYHTFNTIDPTANIERFVPHRMEEGYGLNAEALEKLIDDGAELIISVDCGITAIEQAAKVKARGVDLIITDHHEMAETLPDAYALVHPMIENEQGEVSYPFSGICGAGVAYKLAWQLCKTWCGSERVSSELAKLLANLSALAALGTIADVMPLQNENRAIVACGLTRVKHTPIEGLNALVQSAGLKEKDIDSFKVGFVLAPRLNACGRMGHAKHAVKLFTDAAGDEAKQIAKFLDSENNKRKQTEKDIVKAACEKIETLGYDKDDVRAIVLADPDWHAGVIGIVCSRLVEKYGKPAFLLQERDGLLQGSCRSIDGFNVVEALTACDEFLEKYGGHAAAAGLKLAPANFEAFRDAIIRYANERISVEELTPALKVHFACELGSLSEDLVSQVEKMAPFGQGNAKPNILIRGLTVADQARPMGSDGSHLQMRVKSGQTMLRCIAWQMGDLAARLHAGTRLDIVCRPNVNEWNGRRNVELELQDMKILEA